MQPICGMCVAVIPQPPPLNWSCTPFFDWDNLAIAFPLLQPGRTRLRNVFRADKMFISTGRQRRRTRMLPLRRI
eukprot:363864-Chlamydomonas_euryale.AAC.14